MRRMTDERGRLAVVALAAATATNLVAMSPARATVTPYSSDLRLIGGFQPLTPVATDFGALQDDPTLLRYDVFDLQVSISPGDHWYGMDLRAQLANDARFYIPPSLDSNLASGSIRDAAGVRFLRDDVFVAAPGATFPDGSRAVILGSSNRNQPPDAVATFPSNGSNLPDTTDPNGTRFLTANDQMLVDVSWGDPNSSASTVTGIRTVARLTVLRYLADGTFVHGDPAFGGRRGVVVGDIVPATDPSSRIPFTFIIPAVPEPAAVVLIAAAVGLTTLRRRRSDCRG